MRPAKVTQPVPWMSSLKQRAIVSIARLYLGRLEVFELYHDVRPPIEDRLVNSPSADSLPTTNLHEFVHHLEVLLALEAGQRHAHVTVVLAQRLGRGWGCLLDRVPTLLLVPTSSITGSTRCGNDTRVRVGVRARRQLAYGDAHAVCTEVTQAEDAAAVGDDDDVDIVVLPVEAPGHVDLGVLRVF
eukprot:scaffold107255_cov54-Phaeocystis_antarctica.AAC.2